MVNNTAFTGSYTKNFYFFKHNRLTFLAANVNGKNISVNPVTLNVWKGEFLGGYRSLFTTSGKINRDEANEMTRSECKDGFSLFGFDLCPALCVGGHQQFFLRVSLEFSQPLQTLTTIILYAQYNNLINVYKTRQVLKNY